MTGGLTLKTLRAADIRRIPQFKNKKGERGDLTLAEARPPLAEELADVQAYLDLLAYRAGVDLGRATIAKFNEVSARFGSTIRIKEDGSGWEYSK